MECLLHIYCIPKVINRGWTEWKCNFHCSCKQDLFLISFVFKIRSKPCLVFVKVITKGIIIFHNPDVQRFLHVWPWPWRSLKGNNFSRFLAIPELFEHSIYISDVFRMFHEERTNRNLYWLYNHIFVNRPIWRFWKPLRNLLCPLNWNRLPCLINKKHYYLSKYVTSNSC